ncbi:MAG: MFS transporter [Lachnospiraceae bacterium]
MKNLTFRYSVTHFTFWAASSGAASFATTYLLAKGISSGIVGILLASAGLLSCLTQPFLASIVDNAKQFVLIKMLLIMSALCCVCFSTQLIPQFPLFLTAIFYMIGIWSSDAMVPLLNALSVAYNKAGYSINYGVSRGIGSAATAISSLVLGFVIAQFGITWMILFLLVFRLICMFIIAGYPKIRKEITSAQNVKESCSIFCFFSHYRWYCVSLLGILFLGMFHAMTENYLIAIMGALGGDSSHVGTALFISAMVGAPVIFCFSYIHKYIGDTCLLKIAAVSFLIKAILFFFAKDITTIYLLQLLQTTSYAFLAPTQVYYANAKVESSDMVKGQAFITAAYALGCSAGNFMGGQLLRFSVKAILIGGIIMTLVGTIIIFISVNKSDFEK